MFELSWVKTAFWDLLFPSLCLGCSAEGDILCSACLRGLMGRTALPACLGCGFLVPGGKRIPAGRTCRSCRAKSSIYAFLAPLNYEDGVVRGLIHSLKYRHLHPAGKILGEMLANYLRSWGFLTSAQARSSVILTAIPLHPARERVRGFNQSVLIARGLAGKLNLELEEEALGRVKKTKPQTGLNSEERKKNVWESFAILKPGLVKGKTIVLVDDVATTGATLEEAARVLKGAGAQRVWAVTVAH